jgi:hypothetical protein
MSWAAVVAVHCYRSLQTHWESCAWVPPSEILTFIRHIAKILLGKWWQVQTCMTIAHLCIHMTMATKVTGYLVSHSRFIVSFFNTVSRYHISYASKMAFNLAANFHFACPKKAICRKLHSCFGSRPTLIENSVVLSSLMQKCWILASAVIVTFYTTSVLNTYQDSNKLIKQHRTHFGSQHA